MTFHTPSTKLEEWRFADPKALERLAPEAFGVVKEVVLAPGEMRRHCMVVGSANPELHRIHLTLGQGARAELFVVVAGDDYTRVDVEVALMQGAHFGLGGITSGGGDATREIVTRVEHAAPEATSNQVVRAVHWGQATGNFLGRINVHRRAQHTDAAQSFKALLLEKGASANAKPELEIFADNVKCAHGAAIGAMDEAARFYMASRGIDPQTAQALLVRAFIADALLALDDEAEAARLLEAALAPLEARA